MKQHFFDTPMTLEHLCAGESSEKGNHQKNLHYRFGIVPNAHLQVRHQRAELSSFGRIEVLNRIQICASQTGERGFTVQLPCESVLPSGGAFCGQQRPAFIIKLVLFLAFPCCNSVQAGEQ